MEDGIPKTNAVYLQKWMILRFVTTYEYFGNEMTRRWARIVQRQFIREFAQERIKLSNKDIRCCVPVLPLEVPLLFLQIGAANRACG